MGLNQGSDQVQVVHAIVSYVQPDGSYNTAPVPTPPGDSTFSAGTIAALGSAIGAAVAAAIFAAAALTPLSVKLPGTQAVSLTAPTGVAVITTTGVIATTGQLLIAANPNRKGFYLYNNSANSIYVTFGSPPCAGSNITFILATFAQFVETMPVHYTGPLCGMHNAGSGTVTITEIQ